ncbi:MAG: HAMP domain-containing protein [Alphaproteobacteria bacterium]|nr:HAMP domain-containing protein [Alphaproteobacteria bacterium]
MRFVKSLNAFRKSLLAQILAVSLGGVASFFIIIAILFQTTIIFRIFPASLGGAVRQFSDLAVLIEDIPADTEELVLSAVSGSGLVALIHKDFPPGSTAQSDFLERFASIDEEVAAFAAAREVRFRYLSRFGVLNPRPERSPDKLRAVTALEISTKLQDGRTISVVFPPAAFFLGGSLGPFALISFIALMIGIVTIVLIKHALRPLQDLERATQHFDGVNGLASIEDNGAEEIRRLARALNASQRRVKTLMDERSRMVSAIAHDVRTAITKLRLRLDQPENVDHTEIEQDLVQMQRLIEDMLTYAKSNQLKSRLELVNLAEFAKTYVKDAPTQIRGETLGADAPFVIAADPLALTRVLNNLVDNAMRYGGGVTLTFGLVDDGFEIRVEDDGPGIPEEHLESVFEPFFRLETSRNRDTGGSGLGLGIARVLTEAQGGVLTLRNRPSGGLSAIMTFPEPCKVS